MKTISMKLFIMSFFVLFTGLIKAQTTITIGNGTASGTSAPVASWYNSSATESIYTGTEIGATGTINKIAYQKASGSAVTEPYIKVYMKMTATETMGTTPYVIGTTNFNTYTLVYDGNIPNAAVSGNMQITLQTPFVFSDSSKNLSVLVIGSVCISSGRPQYRYTTTPTKMSAGFTDGSIGCDGNNPWTYSSNMAPVWERPNLVLTMDAVLSVEENEFDANDLQIFIKERKLEVISQKSNIAEVTVFDLAGRKLADNKGNTATVVMDLPFPNQILIINVKTTDHKVFHKKIIF